LTSEGLLSLLTPIINTKINGEIILDLSLFKTPTHSPNIIIGDVGTKYAQPVSSFNLDKNLINVTVIPAELGKLASVYNDSQFKMDANVLTTDDESMVRLVWDLDVIKLSGSINPKDKPLKLQISPQEIDFYALSKVRQILKKLNIRGKLKIVKEQAQLPVHATQLHAIKSMPLQEMLIPGMRESDNLMFDSIYLKLINLQTSAGDWSDGDKKIKSLISKHLGVNVGQALFVDGSGLSRYNRVQPRKLFEILKKGYSVPEFMNSLPYPGERGASVPKIAGLASNIRAKTGRMSGIACLCGYGANKAFVIMVSGFAPHDLMPGISKFISGQVGG
jgi:D-alanyl-D-alanine carboxypeptidase/D-alanyl-D-alanine-endopeptidase (penicillin-binding protein 4)